MKKQIDYKAEVLKSVEEEYRIFKETETAKKPEEIFEDSPLIMQYLCAYRLVKNHEFTQDVYESLFGLRGYILSEIIDMQGEEYEQ